MFLPKIRIATKVAIDKQNFSPQTMQPVYISVEYIDGLVQDCSIYIANELEIHVLQSCNKQSISNFL